MTNKFSIKSQNKENMKFSKKVHIFNCIFTFVKEFLAYFLVLRLFYFNWFKNTKTSATEFFTNIEICQKTCKKISNRKIVRANSIHIFLSFLRFFFPWSKYDFWSNQGKKLVAVCKWQLISAPLSYNRALRKRN